MSREKSPSQASFDEFLRNVVSPIMKHNGFKRSGSNYYKREGEVAFVINFQSSSRSNWEEKIFYINVGASFDEICKHQNIRVLEKPKEYECRDRGFSVRIEKIYGGLLGDFTLKINENHSCLSGQMELMLSDLAQDLSDVYDLASYRKSKLFDIVQGDPGMKSLIYFLNGEDYNAGKEIDRLVAQFADRRKLSQKSYWLERYNIDL